MIEGAFSPLGDAVTQSIGATSSTAALPGNGGGSAWVYNAGAVYVSVRFGDSSGVVATAADTPIPPATAVVLGIPPGTTHVAVIGSAAGPSTVIVQRGGGL